MWVDWDVCIACWETYPDCSSMTTECENYTFCEGCVDYDEYKAAGKLNEDWLIKKEFFEVKEVEETIIKTEFIFK